MSGGGTVHCADCSQRKEDKTLNIWFQEILAFFAWFVYGSYFEWLFHKHLFHSPKYVKRTFRAHTLIHHQVYKGDHTYSLAEGKEPEHVAMDWWALIAFLTFHLPLIWAVQALTGWQCLWGGLAAICAYYGLYEYLHWCMHVPDQRPFEQWRVYRFLREHHRLHHVHMQKNLNVILPLADLTLGTLKRETRRADMPDAPALAERSARRRARAARPAAANAAGRGKNADRQ